MVITVREWFRLQRKQLWDSQPELAAACETVANAIDHQYSPPVKPYYIGDFRWLLLTAEEVHHHELMDLIRQDMLRARYTAGIAE